MTFTETQIWDRFNTNKPILITANWLEEVYSLDISTELRWIIGERLGLLAKQGWNVIKVLIHDYGNQPELIHAAGLCHQKESCDFLLKRLREQGKPEITVVRALACWGAILSTSELKNILSENSLQMRLAGLNLLKFKVHLLSVKELLDLIVDLLDDFREEVVIQSIKILQRRDEKQIIDCISHIARNGTDKTVEISLIALGSIGTKQSVDSLSKLSRELVSKTHRRIAQKQISHQYIH
tara:strand:- start:45 stop:761 length:717 start_codon:yes stop_codon:yes gene_type:complete